MCVLFIFLFINSNNNFFQEEIFFFKTFRLKNPKDSQDLSNQKSNIELKISHKNIDFKNVNLSNTINKNSLIDGKIAPGTSGSFEISLETNNNIKYQLKFKSKNDKPQNLNFQIKGKDKKYKTLEEMSNELYGNIKNKKTITINWQWEFEKSKIQNIQDTKDGEKLVEYNFTIYAIGYQ